MCEVGQTHMNETNQNQTTHRKYRRYDEAFKRQAVEHWMLSGKPARQIAAELGLNAQTLGLWKKAFIAQPAAQVGGTLEALQTENRRLQRELQHVSRQRDILKKTLGIISNSNDDALHG
jgi:transposase